MDQYRVYELCQSWHIPIDIHSHRIYFLVVQHIEYFDCMIVIQKSILPLYFLFIPISYD